MATATVLAPSAHYPSQTSFSTSYPPHRTSSGSAGSNMLSIDSRRAPEENGSPRQSLPSISEVISGTRPGQYPTGPSGTQPGSALPSPFTSSSRSFSDVDKHASPQPLHHSSFPSRQDTLPAFSDSPRSAFNTPSSLPPVTDRRPSPSAKSDSLLHHSQEPHKPSEPHSLNGSYSQHHASAPQYQSGQLPHGQMPLPRYPISPRHSHPHTPGQYDPRGQPPMHSEGPDSYPIRPRHDGSSGRHIESWNYQESLSKIGSASRTVYNFAEAYGRIAQEQHGLHPIPERLPTDREVSEMLYSVDLIKRSLEQVREAVQISIQSERAREGTKPKHTYDDSQDVAMYGDGMKPQYSISEVKKRRGRAAPPGRCHSCNRVDTPEWRRGPDGARTLCNACGLHYAKLERKRQQEARSLRPKPEDRN